MSVIANTLAKNGVVIEQGLLDQADFDENFCFEPPCHFAATVRSDLPLSIGAFTHINGGFIQNAVIGRYCSIARDVQIGHGGHPVDWLSVSPLQYVDGYRNWETASDAFHPSPGPRQAKQSFGYGKLTTIGNDVWLGNHVFVRDGVSIGDGAVVGAHSTVTRDLPPYSVAFGSPARVIRLRFDQATIDRLMNIRWWDYRLTDFPIDDFSNVGAALSRMEDAIKAGAVSVYAPPKLYPKQMQKEL